MAKKKRYYRGVWIADNTAIAQALDVKTRLRSDGTPMSPKEVKALNVAEANKHFNESMKDYHRNFPNPEFPDDPRRVSASYSLPGL